MRRENKMTVGVLIPCHNEEETIAACINSCLNQTVKPNTIIVVNDGSTDRSGEILDSFGDQISVVNISEATGNKSYAQEIGLRYIEDDVFITTDGDTILDERFVEEVLKSFEDENVGAVSGYIKSIKHNYLTALREFEYVIGQEIHKRAQANINFLLVIPGCAGVFRTSFFKEHIGFDHDTLCEDLDFTYKMHRANRRVVYNKNAIVYTQDPATISDYINQVRRWYGGGWQNLKKHWDLISKPKIALEVTLAYFEGFMSSFLLLALPLINIQLFIKLMFFYILFVFFLGVYVALKRHRLDVLFVSPLVVFFMMLNAVIFLEQFVREIVLFQRNLNWFQPSRRSH